MSGLGNWLCKLERKKSDFHMHYTGASVVKTAELLNVPKDVVSQVMAAYSKHGQSALVELVKKKPQHRHKKPPPTQIAVSSRAPCSLFRPGPGESPGSGETGCRRRGR
uniref:Uncharacterized protein n=1 Tax=Astyanax mexicanus TaxID=7994 RepID=A0A8B9REX4_ASTMX